MTISKKVITNTQVHDVGDIKLSKDISKSNKLKNEILRHIMTGLSYMVPVLVLYSLVRALEQTLPIILLGVDSKESLLELVQIGENTDYIAKVMSITHLLKQLRELLFQMTIPLFAAFTANSIGGKSALILGFLGGCIAINPIMLVEIVGNEITTNSITPSGFLGGMIIALIMGYTVRYLSIKIKLKNRSLALKMNLIIPTIGLLLCIGVTTFIINPIVGYVGSHIKGTLLYSGELGEYIYSILVAMGTTFDLGGPVNKTTGLVCSGFLIEGVFPVTARTLSVVIPSIGLGLSTIIDKAIVGRKIYNKSFCESGKTALWLGILGISEGSLPFALERPHFVIPINMIGAIIGTLLGIKLGAVQNFPESAIWAWGFADNVLAYVIGVLVGAMFIALSNIYYRNMLIKKGKIIL